MIGPRRRKRRPRRSNPGGCCRDAIAVGLEEIFIIEERREIVENQVKQELFNHNVRPRIVGKMDELDKRFLPFAEELGLISADTDVKKYSDLTVLDDATKRLK